MNPSRRRGARVRSEASFWTRVSPRPKPSRLPGLEVLESRRVPTYLGPSAQLPVTTSAGDFSIQVSGPGVVSVQPAPYGMIDLKAYGTTAASTITITQTQQRYHFPGRLLMIRNFVVRSRQLGALVATTSEFDGRMTPLSNYVNQCDVGALGPRAQVDISGGLAELSASSIILGPLGSVSIAEGINEPPQIPGASGSYTLGSVTINAMSLNGGRFAIAADSTLPFTVQGNLTISQDGELSIGRDEAGSLEVGGSLILQSGGQLRVGRNMNDATVGGNLIIGPAGSGIAVGGELNALTVAGSFQGQGGTSNPTAIDLGVGLNLSGLTVLSGIPGQGGLIDANVRAGGGVNGVSIVYGTYNSTIQSNALMNS